MNRVVQHSFDRSSLVSKVRGPDGGYLVPIVEKFEMPAADELDDIEKIADMTVEAMADIHAMLQKDDPDVIVGRDAHAKHQGCVRGEFAVRSDLPAELAIGAFQPGTTYKAWVRFSNSFAPAQRDNYPDGRGMAIKITGVPGRKLLEGVVEENEWSIVERGTQDLLLFSRPIVPFRNAKDFTGFASGRIVTGAQRPKHWAAAAWYLLSNLRFGKIALDTVFYSVYNPLEVPWHSVTPSLLGPDRVVKYLAVPVSYQDGSPIEQTKRSTGSPNYLRKAMVEHLDPTQGKPACFDFRVILGPGDPEVVEDGSRDWAPEEIEEVSVATLTIPQQTFTSDAQMAFCENSSFAPWNTLPGHQPLGSVNRIRLPIYRLVSELRHKLNGVKAVEPTGDEQF